MSKSRQDGSLVRSFSVTFHSRQTVVYPAPGWDLLLYAAQGAVSAETAQGTWVLPAHRALWVPDGVTHALHSGPNTALRSLYFRARQARQMPRRCAAVNVSPLLRELILVCTNLSALSARRAAHRRLAAVLLDQLRTLPSVPLQLPWPKDPRALRLAQALRAKPAWSLAEAAGPGIRTLERLFRQETGLSLGAWLRRLRLQTALEGLAAGESVSAVAARCGYSGPSAFVAMFRRELGQTPGRYFGLPE
jgi:AraC-like DNA-binding protein